MALPKWVSDLENKCSFIHTVLNLGRRIETVPEYVQFLWKRWKRRRGIECEEFNSLKLLKDKYKGERCFIVATGPSLSFEDLNLIKDEYCFGMNSICKIYNKTDWRPNFYGIQDRLVFNKMKNEVFNQDESILIFTADVLKKYAEIPKRCVQFPFNVCYHYCNFRRYDDYYAKFSDDCYDTVYDGYSITYSLIEIAIYMGFNEIYLIGADCNYNLSQKHFVESGFVDKRDYLNHDKMIEGYKAAKEYADANGINIINCTRGGMLDVFPRMVLEDVIKVSKK